MSSRAGIETMSISNVRQFGLLLWKNWLLQKRQIILTIFQILLPTLFAFVLLAARTATESETIETPIVWNSFKGDAALPDNLVLSSSQEERYWQLAYAPDLPVVTQLMNSTASLLSNASTVNPFRRGVIVGKGKLHILTQFTKTPWVCIVNDQCWIIPQTGLVTGTAGPWYPKFHLGPVPRDPILHSYSSSCWSSMSCLRPMTSWPMAHWTGVNPALVLIPMHNHSCKQNTIRHWQFSDAFARLLPRNQRCKNNNNNNNEMKKQK